jgi:hypothetical protein
VHQRNILAIVARLSAKPFIRAESGTFVGRFGDHEDELGSTEAGLADETAIPSEYKVLLLKVPALKWKQLLDGLAIEQRSEILRQVHTPEVTLDKRSIKAAIDGGVDVPGAGLAIGRHALRRS